jgi:hypothetical protein
MAFQLPSVTHPNPETGASETTTNAYGVITSLTLNHHTQQAQAIFAVYASAAARAAGGRPLVPPVVVSWSAAAYEAVFAAAPTAPPTGLTAPTTAEDIAIAQAYAALPANTATATLLTGATAA